MNWRQRKLLPYVMAMVVILAALGVLGYGAVQRVASLGDELYEHPFRVSNAALRIRGNALRIQVITQRALQTGTSEATEEYFRSTDELEKDIAADFQVLQSQFLGDPLAVEEAVQAFGKWELFRDGAVNRIRQGQRQEGERIIREFGEREAEMVLAKIDYMVRFANDKAIEFRQQSQRAGERTRSVVLVGLTMALILAGFVVRRIIAVERELNDNNIILAARVATRTNELANSNQQLITANQQLMIAADEKTAMNEELTAMNEELTAMNEELTAMNEQLQALNGALVDEVDQRRLAEYDLLQAKEELENRVQERTVELADANRQLERELIDRIRADAALQEKEEWYRAIMEQSWDAVALVDCATKKVLETNRRWREITGYSQEDTRGMTAYDVLLDGSEAIDARYEMLRHMGHSLPAISRLRAKNGEIVEMERVGSLLRVGGKEALLFCSRDLSEERRLQYQIHQDMLLAGEVQKNLLPGDFNDAGLEVETIFHPQHLVSGDFFDYGWSDDYLRFSGFVLDVSGHGVASSLLGIVVSTYFRDVLNSPMNLSSRLHWINRQVRAYFEEDSYGAALYFEFDFLKQTLTYAGAGVHTLLASNTQLSGWTHVPGSLIGIGDDPDFSQEIVSFAAGDTFYFLTDGIFDRMKGTEAALARDFPRMMELLRTVAVAEERRDDCSAVCVRIKDHEKFPLVMKYHRHGRNNRIRIAVSQLLNRLAGHDAGKLNVAFGEALTNAARESMEVQVRINRLGNRLVMRVRDHGGGFDGNGRVAAIRQDVDGSMFEQILLAEGGRGIMIMVSWLDKVIYNRQGNEVMLVKRLSIR